MSPRGLVLACLAAVAAALPARAADARVKLRVVEIVAGGEETTDPAIEPYVAEALRKFYGPQFKGKLALALRGSEERTGPVGTETRLRCGKFALAASVSAIDAEKGRVSLELVCEKEKEDGGAERLFTLRCTLGAKDVFPVEVPEKRRADRTSTWAVTARTD